MPDLRTIAKDPDFQALPMEEKIKAFSEYDKEFAILPDEEKIKGITELSTGFEKKTIPQRIAGKVAPYAPIAGATAGGIVAAPANLIAPGVAEALGIGGGYLIGSEAERRLKEFAGEKKTPEDFLGALKETGKVIPEAAEAGISGPLIGKLFQAIPKWGARRLYESGMKIPPSVPNIERQKAIEIGLKESVPITQKGLTGTRKAVDDLSNQVSAIIDSNKSGNFVNMDSVISRTKGLKDFYKDVPEAQKFLDKIDELVAPYQGTQKPIAEAQELKQKIYKLNRDAYGEFANITRETNKQIARGLKEEIETILPGVKGPNLKQSELLRLEEHLERAVNRTRNYDIWNLGDIIAGGIGGSIGGYAGGGVGASAGATSAMLARRILGDPAVKSYVSFLMNKMGKSSGKYVSGPSGYLTSELLDRLANSYEERNKIKE